MYKNIASSSLKRAAPSIDSSVAPKKSRKTKTPRTTTGDDEDDANRKQFLRQLRAICDRYAVHMKAVDAAGKKVDGKELLRLFLRSELLGLYKLEPCQCVHGGGHLPPGKEPCRTGGTKDKLKAVAFVKHTLKGALRDWLEANKSDPDLAISDVESSDEEEGGEVEEDAEESQPAYIPSSYALEAYPSSPESQKRKSTKQRLTVLYYLLSHSGTSSEFATAFRNLCDPDLHLVHLCGCGVCTGTFKACVTGSHLKLAKADLNREHVHYHRVLHAAPTKDAYLALCGAVKGSEGGRFDDVF